MLLFYPNIGWSQNQVMLPLLHGQTWEQASQRLIAMGLQPRRTPPRQPCQDELQINRIVDQYPQPGTWLAIGSRVILVACEPVVVPLQRQVPDLSGLTLAQGKYKLRELGLKLRYSYNYNCLDPFLQGKIIKQEPAALSQVRPGAILWVSVCQGAP